jgi:hypothetical protein
MSYELLAIVPARDMDDTELRRVLADTHRLAEALSARVAPDVRDELYRRCDELDAEYLRRFPGARETWPWPVPAVASA